MKNILKLSVLALILSACSSSPKLPDDQKVISTGTSDQKLPFWTFDDVNRKKLAEAMGDDTKDPKNMYIIAKATVDNEDLVPNCYQMARTRTSAELAQGVSNVVKESNALAQSASASEFEGVIATQTQQMVVGAAIAEKTWAKIDRAGNIKVQCWVVMAVPRDNLKKLQDLVFSTLEKQNNGNDPELKARVKTAIDKMQDTLQVPGSLYRSGATEEVG